MDKNKVLNYIDDVVANMPMDWLTLTTHRLDIYKENLAKKQFLEEFENLFSNNISTQAALSALPTAYDYIRLGHPLSSILEWGVAKVNQLKAENVISFSSNLTPILAVLRKNLLDNKATQIVYIGELPNNFIAETIQEVYGYKFELKQIENTRSIPAFEGSTILMTDEIELNAIELSDSVDFLVILQEKLGSIILVNGEANECYVKEIQHVRRRETIAMTPINCLTALEAFTGSPNLGNSSDRKEDKATVLKAIQTITGSNANAVVGSSGLSIQYAIVMGLIHNAIENYPGKAIKVVVPPNCYGGTNDQARRVAACLDNVEVMDLPVDGGNDMVESIDTVLGKIADIDAVPLIIVEIPTNPRVEVPDLEKLKNVLTKSRPTGNGSIAIDPVFILDQTFCPNFYFLRDEDMLSEVRTISYVSGSKFPSGGMCTAGYCTANSKANDLMEKIELHLSLCDNEATDLQMEILANQLPSMNDRIASAYKNTREFVNFVQETLPEAKINFVSEELANQGFTPSVFSLDLPTKGDTDEERENYKRELNLKLINMMIETIPSESKYCVSYGQLKGCYWTIPATSTQGTTKEGDKDYIVRVALSGNMNLEKHKEVFAKFVSELVHSKVEN